MVNMAALLVAIAAVESGGNDSAFNARETATGRYQIRPCVVADVNRMTDWKMRISEMHNPISARMVAIRYLTHWGAEYERTTGKPLTPEVLARIWNGGPTGWKKKATQKYWDKVKVELEKQQKEDRK